MMRRRFRFSLIVFAIAAAVAAAIVLARNHSVPKPLLLTLSDNMKSVSVGVTQSVSIGLAQRDITATFHKRRLNLVILGVCRGLACLLMV